MNDKLPPPRIVWTGPDWETARKFVAQNPSYFLERARLSGHPLLYSNLGEKHNISKGLTGQYDLDGKKIGPLPSSLVFVFIPWEKVNWRKYK